MSTDDQNTFVQTKKWAAEARNIVIFWRSIVQCATMHKIAVEYSQEKLAAFDSPPPANAARAALKEHGAEPLRSFLSRPLR